jgi:tetratricopeptide (TPR) repeat protein
MIKFIFRLFFLLIAASFTLAILYVFELPPFKKTAVPATTEQTALVQEQQTLPSNLQDTRVGRNKTYDEMIARAALLEQNNFPSLAIAQYMEAYKKDSTNLQPLYEIGKIDLRTKNFDKAAGIFQELVGKDPDNNDAKIYLGRSLLNQRKISEAKVVFNQISIPNQTSKYYQGIIAAYFGENDNAQTLLNESVSMGGSDEYKKKANNFLAAYNEYKFNTESPSIHLKVLLARSFDQCGEYEMAIPLLFEVTKEKLDYRDAWILLGYAYIETEKYQDAVEALERAKVLDNQKPETLFYLGLAYYNINNFKLAEENLLKAKEFGFEPKILVDQKLAEVYLELKNYPQSAASYEKVLALNSQDVNYYIRPIWIYIEKMNEPQKALVLAEKAAKDHPDEAMAQNLMGWTLIYNNQFDKAETHLKLAMALNPALDATYLNFGILYEKENQTDKALQFYKKAHTIGKGSGVAASAATRYNQLLASLSPQDAKSMQTNLIQP